MPDDVQVQCEAFGDTLMVTIRGEAGVRQLDRLDGELGRICAQRPTLAVVDLAGLTFLSSIGLGALLAFKHAIERTGGRVRLVAVPPAVLGVIRRSRLEPLFDIRQ